MTINEIDDSNRLIQKIIVDQPKEAYQKSIENYRASISIMHQRGLADACRNLAFSSHALGFIEDSFDYIQECVSFYLEEQEYTTVAHLKNLESFIYEHLGDHEKRITSSQQSCEFATKSENKELIIRSLNNLGDSFLAAKNIDQAIQTFEKVLDELSHDDNFMRAVVHCNLADAYNIKGNFAQAKTCIEYTINTIDSFNIPSLREASVIILGRILIAEQNFTEVLSLFEHWGISNSPTNNKPQVNEVVRLTLNTQIEINELKIAAYEGLANYETAYKLIKQNEEIKSLKNKEDSGQARSLFYLRKEINLLKTNSEELNQLIDKRTGELNHALTELRRKEEKSKTILNHSSNAILLLNSECEIIETNTKGELWFGEDVIHRPFFDIFTLEPDQESTVKKSVNRLLYIEGMQPSSLQFELFILSSESVRYFDITIIKLEAAQNTQLVAFLHDVSVHKELEQLRLQELNFESAVSKLNERFQRQTNIKSIFEIYLQEVAENLNLKEAHLFWVENNPHTIQSVASFANYPINELTSDPSNELNEDSLIYWPKIRSNSETVKQQKTLKFNNQVRGLIEFIRVNNAELSNYESKFLSRASEQLLFRIEQIEGELKKDALQIELIQMNQKLEEEVDRQITELQQLQHKFNEHEKLILLSEINTSLSHEINTPLGVIKSANQIVYEQFDSFLEFYLRKQFSPVELDFIKAHRQKKIHQPISALQRLSEKQAYYAYYEEKIEKNPDFDKIIDYLIECRFTLDHKEDIDFILASKSAIDLLKVIVLLKTVESFHDNANSNIQRIGNILSEIQSIADITSEENYGIQIKSQFDNLRHYFQRDLGDKELRISIPEDLIIKGNEMSLSLLWFNLLKNSIEALDAQDNPNKNIQVSSIENETSIEINIANNGPEISPQDMDKIFNKFYSTKTDKNRSGLGLSISQKIAQDHQAEISCESNPLETNFTIRFKKSS
jgi:signal transduction histidine kinase/PAS domain-containing protein